MLLPKLYSLAGLRFARRLAISFTVSVSSGVAGASLLLVDPDGGPAAASLLAIACVGASVSLALLFVPAGEVFFRCGMTHMPSIFRWVLRPVVLLLGLSAAIAVWLGASPADIPRLWMIMALIIPGLLAAVVGGLVSVYATAVVRHRARQVGAWARRLPQFRRAHPGADLSRVENFISMENSARPALASHAAFFPGVSLKSFHDEFTRPAWMNQLEEQFDVVRRELLAIVADETALAGEGKGWFRFNRQFKMFKLYRDQWFAQNCARCPTTAAILSTVHTNSEIVVAALHPGGRLRNHVDFAAPTLVYQLGIKVPPRCGIRVGTETREWVEGKALVFDNAFEHEVWNDSDDVRVVLLVDFCHPELTAAERRFFSTTGPDSEAATGQASQAPIPRPMASSDSGEADLLAS